MYLDGGQLVDGLARSLAPEDWDRAGAAVLPDRGRRPSCVGAHRGCSRRSPFVGVCAAATAVAQNMPKLPADITLQQSGDSPGKVMFSHQSHLSYQAKPDCTVCHPKLAPIMKSAQGVKRAPTTHAAMLKGAGVRRLPRQDAHNFDDCTSCHK